MRPTFNQSPVKHAIEDELFWANERFCLNFCCRDAYGGDMRARRSSGPARPYIARLRAFRRLICPSVWPLLQGSAIAFLTALMSLCNARANRCIA
jgi:hypothetical protein